MKNNWVSLLALLVSIIALMLSYRVVPVDFKDYWGFVLGVQSLLVTILIGWQILNVFEVKRQIEDFNETISKLKKENENIIHDKISDYDLTVSALFQQLEGIRQFNSGHGKDALAFFMESLKLLNTASDKTPVDGLVSYILGIKSEKLYVSPISKEDIDVYLQIISDCTSEKKTELLKYVMSLPVSKENDN